MQVRVQMLPLSTRCFFFFAVGVLVLVALPESLLSIPRQWTKLSMCRSFFFFFFPAVAKPRFIDFFRKPSQLSLQKHMGHKMDSESSWVVRVRVYVAPPLSTDKLGFFAEAVGSGYSGESS